MNELIHDLEFQLAHGAVKEKSEYFKNYPSFKNDILNIFDLEYLKQYLVSNFQEIIIRNCSLYKKTMTERQKEKLTISPETIDMSFKVLAYKHGVTWNTKEPFQSFVTTINNSLVRISLLNCDVGCSSHQFFIRSINTEIFQLEDFTDNAELLKQFVKDKRNVLIAGASGSGKTSLINSMLTFIEPLENLVVIEDTKEILCSNENISRMHSKDSQKLMKYCSYAVRMAPDRLILGEMRSHEVISFILAMNSGAKGMLSSIHANTALDAIHRVAQLFDLYSEKSSICYEQTLRFICKNIDFVCFMKEGKIIEILKILNYQASNIIFEDLTLH